MSSIATAVFKATIGLLVKKGRDKAADKLKGGDVTDQKFRGLIVREIDEIKSKLDGLSRKDLLASISFFKEGIELLYEVFDKVRSRSGVETSQASFAESFSLVKGVKNLDLANLNDSATRAFANAKERFRDARRKATEAFSNEALETSDRILAMQYRVMATILETVDNPEDAVVPCRVCIEELHCLSAVQECFSVELTKGFRARFGKDERRKIICNVCHVNFVIYDVTLMICFGNKELSNWPCIGSGGYAVDPLRDRRVTKVLRKQGMEHCCVTPWSFGQEDEEEHKLKIPQGIATNSSGQFIVADSKHNEVKLFDSCGIFWDHFSPTDDEGTTLNVLDVATDINDYIYVLVELNDFGCEHLVYKFKSNADLYHWFPVRGGHWYRVTVTGSGKVLVLGRPTGVEPSAEKGDKKASSSRSALRARVLRSAFSSGKSPVPQASIPEESDAVDVYEMDGQFVCSLGERKLKDARDITTANYGRVMVVDRKGSCVHMFTEDGEHLNTFKLQGCYSFPKIAFHRASEHVVVAGIEQEKSILHVEIYTRDGEFIRSTEIHEEGIDDLQGMTVTIEGRIAVVFRVLDENYKILVV